jgi:cation:H+ antiporter
MFVLIWGKFLLLLLLIYIFGNMAAKAADVIAEKMQWSRAFMGAIFLSMITSFPELFTGISAVTIVKDNNMALGEIMGSCIFNLFIIVLIELLYRKLKIYSLKTKKINFLSYSYSFIIIAVVTFLIAVKFNLGFLSIGFSSLIIIILYVFFVRILFREKKEIDVDLTKIYQKRSLKREVILFIISSFIIIGVGIYLPIVGGEISTLMNWNGAFIGVVFLALVTSFPELIVCISAARIGSMEMVFGNIAGSNLFNISIIFILDIFYRKGLFLADVSERYVPIGIIIMLMNFIVLFAIMRKSKKRLFSIISINALALAVLYIISIYLSY